MDFIIEASRRATIADNATHVAIAKRASAGGVEIASQGSCLAGCAGLRY